MTSNQNEINNKYSLKCRDYLYTLFVKIVEQQRKSLYTIRFNSPKILLKQEEHQITQNYTH